MATINRKGNIETKTGKKSKKDWFIIKPASKKGGIINVGGLVINFPERLIGKKIYLKALLVEEEKQIPEQLLKAFRSESIKY